MPSLHTAAEYLELSQYLKSTALKTEELSECKARETSVSECQGPQFVVEFSGSKGRLLYKTTHKDRQTNNTDINEPDHFRTNTMKER